MKKEKKQKNVERIDETNSQPTFYCQNCGTTFMPALQPGGVYRKDFRKCPRGCKTYAD